ncbi:hypothetical protein BDP27DRAFT_360255 [Rhodocollybia butyracea]|uniref:Uncharacterized protein n=1 Tax=Rhodocollybia butyracea TaxID=206335 RepID=A0A9P5PG50_9AGAR|nr:hypothetical protein BDP27DRAFT_360255 [Rhodocollybia butyracea]
MLYLGSPVCHGRRTDMPMNPAPPKSIHLDQLLHFHSVNIRSFAAWFQQISAVATDHRSIKFDHQGTAFMLELVASSLRELDLHGPFRNRHEFNNLLLTK